MNNLKQLLILVLTFGVLLLSGCSNGISVVGNPSPLPIPETNDQPPTDGTLTGSFTKGILSKHPNWKGSLPSADGINPTFYAINFDLNSSTLKILSTDKQDEISGKFQINDDGSISFSDFSSNNNLHLSAVVKNDSVKYPLSFELTPENEATAQIFSSDSTDPDYIKSIDKSVEDCLKSEIKCNDADNDLPIEAEYMTAGYVRTGENGSGMCNVAAHDYCEVEGALLVEFRCPDSKDSKYGYKVRYVNCNCHEGRCVKDINDETLTFTEHKDTDECQPHKNNCTKQTAAELAKMFHSYNQQILSTPLPTPIN